MKKRIFTIPSLLAAGFLPVNALATTIKPVSPPLKPEKTLFDIFKLDHKYVLAGHRSHSSHSSHSSHRSSTGGYSYAPSAPSTSQRLYNPPTSTQPTYNGSPSYNSGTPKTLPGNSDKFKQIVQQVQLALTAFGYYEGVIDGVMGPQLKNSLMKMQGDYNLKQTGTITPETLDALRIVAQ